MTDRLEWLEDWRAPGICRLAQSPDSGALWAFIHHNEAALVGAPFPADEAESALDQIGGWLSERKLWLKFFTLSARDPARLAALTELARFFDRATLVFPEPWGAGYGAAAVFDRTLAFPYDNLCDFELAGEPIVFVRAPFDTPDDQLIVFRGVALTPRWNLPRGPGDPLPPSEVGLGERRSALRRILDFNRGYTVHSQLAADGSGVLEPDFAERIAYAQALTH